MSHDQIWQVLFWEMRLIDLKPIPSMGENSLLCLCGAGRVDPADPSLADHVINASLIEKLSVQEARTVGPSIYRPQSYSPHLYCH